jgi:hypothetical protein
VVKLKKTVEWLSNLRRIVELFNRCLDAREELNEQCLAMVEMYDHMLTMLGENIKYFRTRMTGQFEISSSSDHYDVLDGIMIVSF